jgi:hypothetical protein
MFQSAFCSLLCAAVFSTILALGISNTGIPNMGAPNTANAQTNPRTLNNDMTSNDLADRLFRRSQNATGAITDDDVRPNMPQTNALENSAADAEPMSVADSMRPEISPETSPEIRSEMAAPPINQNADHIMHDAIKSAPQHENMFRTPQMDAVPVPVVEATPLYKEDNIIDYVAGLETAINNESADILTADGSQRRAKERWWGNPYASKNGF